MFVSSEKSEPSWNRIKIHSLLVSGNWRFICVHFLKEIPVNFNFLKGHSKFSYCFLENFQIIVREKIAFYLEQVI